MFIWVAADVDRQLEEQKRRIREVEKESGLVPSVVSKLPLHVSLKISAEVPCRAEEALRKDISALLEATDPFEIEPDGIEIHGAIVWIRMKPNKVIARLHEDLCSLFADKYGIAPHEYDLDFIYHTTLFLDPDKEKIEKAFRMIRSLSLPKRLTADRFVIGSSLSGTAGTYAVDAVIEKNMKEPP